MLRIHLLPVMVTNLHAKRPSLVGHVPAYPTHTQNPKRPAPGIATIPDGRVTPPLAPPEGSHTLRQIPQRAEEQEHGHVGRGIVDGRRGVGDADLALGAGLDVDLVVPRAVVADELAGRGQGVEELGVQAAGNGDGRGGAVDGHDAVEGAGLGFLDEGGAVGGFGGYDGG